jgi:U6 snRNA-associated Sm-like protein LSm8
MAAQSSYVLLIASHFDKSNFVVQGIMAGFDQKSNVVLSDSKERVYSMEDGVEEIPLGLYLVKGDMVYVYPVAFAVPSAHIHPTSVLIGEIDEAIDKSVDLSTICAEPIMPIRY